MFHIVGFKLYQTTAETMGISVKVVVFFMTAGVSLLCVTGNSRGLADDTCDKKPLNQTAFHGGSVTIHCKYPEEEKRSIKYLCRKEEQEHSRCKELISSHKANYTRLDRFFLTDDHQQGVFNVTISALTVEDAGRYQCGVRKVNSGVTCLTEISLQIEVSDDSTLTEKTSKTGDTVTVDCHYPPQHEKTEKFLCKGENPFECQELIRTTNADRDVETDKFDIRDNQRKKYFFARVKSVTKADSGTYWCGSDWTWGHTKHATILLTVDETEMETEISVSPPPQGRSEDNNSENKPPAPGGEGGGLIPGIIGGVCGGLTLLLISLIVHFRHKIPWKQVCCALGEQRKNAGNNTEGSHGDHHYEEIHLQNQQAGSGDKLQTVSATVNPPANQLLYASVNFNQDSVNVSTDGKALKTQEAAHPPAAEQTLYSTLSPQ